MTLLGLYVISVAFFNYLLVPGAFFARPPWIIGLLLVGRAVYQTLREGRLPRPGPFGLALICFGITTIANGVLVAVTDPPAFNDYLRSEFQFWLALGVVYAFVRARLDEQATARLIKIWVWIAAVAAAFAIYQGFARVLGLPVPTLPIIAKGTTGAAGKAFFGFFRISAWFAEPSWLASFLLVPFVYLMNVILLDPPPPFCFRKRWWAEALAALLALCLFLSLSQAAYATLFVVAVPLLWLLRERLRVTRALRVAGATFALIVASTVFLSMQGADIVQAQWVRFGSIFSDWRRPERAWEVTSFGPRLRNMRAGVSMWEQSPLFGVGINAARYHPDARLLTDPDSGSVDSGLLQLLVEQGLVGFLALAIALAILWERLAQAHRGETDPGRRFLLWFLMWALLTDVVNSLVTHPWQHPQRWLVISLAASYLAYRDSGTPLESPQHTSPT